ncbi:MAG: hypothetical protein K0R50_419 [Eubacterium sp.]|jgi:hypothetical protein|nr:hypothetical protein [Eubacterium sp.]
MSPKCRGCGEYIVFIQTSNGKSMPCDPSLVPYWAKEKSAGKVVTPNGKVISCEFEGDLNKVTGFGYISHFSTCHHAARFKRKRRPS